MGIVLVLEEGQLQRSSIESFLASATGLPEPFERFAHAGLFDLGAWIASGVASAYTSPVGFDVLTLTWSTLALLGDEHSVAQTMDSIERFLSVSLNVLEPRFGYLSHYSNHFETDWIEQRVMIPLLAEEWQDLYYSLYHLVVHAADVPFPAPPSATVLREGPKGRLLRLGAHRSPFG